jgi:Tol biopolymer transport system component
MPKRFFWLALLAFVSLLSWASSAQFVQYFDPSLQWKTLVSPHFNVTYHQGLEGLAQEIAQIAEECRDLIAKEFKKAPEGKIEIVVYDQVDFSNGSANVSPYNSINLITVSARTADRFNVRLESWWRMVIYHELLHVMDLEQVAGINAILRAIFGRATIAPNLSKPVSFIEGLAVYEKWKQLGESRHNDARTEMMMRTFVSENRIPSFSDMTVRNQSRDHWPPGNLLIYDIASWFLRYIEETYGPDKMQKINDLNASNILNLLQFFVGFGSNFGRALQGATGQSPESLMEGYRVWLRKHFEAQLDKIKEEGLTASYRLTTFGWQTGQPAWSSDGQWIAYRASNPARSGLRIMNTDGQKDREVLADIGAAQRALWHPKEEKLAYIKLDVYNLFYTIGDIYEYDVKTKKETRLTYGQRAYQVAYSPDGAKIYFAKYSGRDGSTAIAVYDRTTQKIETLKEYPNNDILIHSLEVSPDGQQLAISAFHRGGFQDIYTMPASGGDLTPVTQDKAIDIDPTWTPDSSTILFTSDRGGVFNLYAYTLGDKTFSKITNTLTGAFDPDVSPDGKEIVFTGYSKEGYDVYKMKYEPNSWKTVTFTQESIPVWKGYPKTEYPIHAYNPIETLLPTGWLPLIDESSVGAIIGNGDLLNQHNYTITAGYDFKKNQPFYDLNYVNTILPIALNVSTGQSASGSYWAGSANFPLFATVAMQQLGMVSYRKDQRIIERPAPDKPGEVTTETRHSEIWSASYQITHARGSDLFRDNLNLRFSGSMTTVVGQAEPERRLTADWREFFRVPTLEGHQLGLRFVAGWSDVVSAPGKTGFGLGGNTGTFLMRGFNRGLIRGQYALAASAEYRLRVMDINQQFGYWPLFFDDLQARPFVDMGLAGEKLDLSQAKFSYGLELRLTTVMGYFGGTAFRLGMAQGLGQPLPLFYFETGTAF